MRTIDVIASGKKTVLAVVAHPDDFEDYFPGTFLYLTERALTHPSCWYLLVCTDGSKGGRDKHTDCTKLVKRREREQKHALSFLGIPHENYFHLEFEDGYIHNNENVLIERIAWYIRKLKPNLLFTHSATDTIIRRPQGDYYVHKDHRTVGQAVLDAMYPYSRDLLFFPHHHTTGLSGHFVREVLLAESGNPDVLVDVTPYLDRKVKLNKIFSSQMDSEHDLRDYFAFTEKEPDGRYYEQFRYINIKI